MLYVIGDHYIFTPLLFFKRHLLSEFSLNYLCLEYNCLTLNVILGSEDTYVIHMIDEFELH